MRSILLILLLTAVIYSQDCKIKLFAIESDGVLSSENLSLGDYGLNFGDSLIIYLDKKYQLVVEANISSYNIDTVKVYSNNVIGYRQTPVEKKKDSYSFIKYNAITWDINNTVLHLSYSQIDKICFVATGGANTLVEIDSKSVHSAIDSSRTTRNEEKNKLKEFLESQAQQLIVYYEPKISGKSYNAAADYLYDEGFGRGYITGSVTKTDFFKSFCYNDSYQPVEYPNGYCIKLHIYLWYSYGYGNLYYSFDYDLPYSLH